MNTLAPKLKGIGNHICPKCNNAYSNFVNLGAHVKQKHPEQLGELAPIKKKMSKCPVSESEFITLKELIVHKRIHKVQSLTCPLCQQTYASKENIIKHYNEDHSLKINTETLEFASFDDFQAWIANIGKDTYASFVSSSGEKKTANCNKKFYECHRSGNTRKQETVTEIMEDFNCILCKINFVNRSNFRAHVKRKHPDKINTLAPNLKGIGNLICPKCNNTYSHSDSLRAHVKKKHPEHLEELARITKKMSKCPVCESEFITLKELIVHKRIHKVQSLTCSLCQQTYAFKEDIIKHYNEDHSLKINTETLEFASFDDFQVWKVNIEKDTYASFVSSSGQRKTANGNKKMYECHRSGNTRKRSYLNIRSLKTQGSNKINAYCPAHMSVLVQDSKCMVSFCKTHVGHKQKEDIRHLFLSASDRQNIAAKIAAKIPLPTILDDIRDTVYNCRLERIHLLTRKDLYNIESYYNLNKTSVRHKNDAVSVDIWVNELKVGGSILFYKPQGTVSTNYPMLKQDDFFLGIMTEGQKEFLLRFGDDCICVDGTHGLNGYGFELHTILVLDDLREGYPCAFLISNRSDAEVMKIFFSCVQAKIEKKIAPKVFMSDMAESYYNAWLQVMYPAEYKLYCTWHVDKAWRKNLEKIPNKEKKILVYQMMRMLLQEREVSTFKILLQKFLTYCRENPETTEFAKYFELYANKQQQWAFCFRLHSGLNTNMHIERMHRTIKHLYLNDKFTKRLDKALSAIMKFVRDKIFQRLIVVHKGKVCTKLSEELRQKHKNSENLDINKVIESETGWIVPSRSGKELYRIEEVQEDCTCTLVCSQCSVCIHRFTCSCMDSSIKWNMCKHVHLVARFLQQNPTTWSAAEGIVFGYQ